MSVHSRALLSIISTLSPLHYQNCLRLFLLTCTFHSALLQIAWASYQNFLPALPVRSSFANKRKRSRSHWSLVSDGKSMLSRDASPDAGPLPWTKPIQAFLNHTSTPYPSHSALRYLQSGILSSFSFSYSFLLSNKLTHMSW